MRPAIRSTFDIISWLDNQCQQTGTVLPPSILMKLLYLAQALYAADNKKAKLMPATFLATDVGPIEPDLFLALEAGVKIADAVSPSPAVEETLTAVWEAYSNLDDTQFDAVFDADVALKTAKARGRNCEILVGEMAGAYPGGMSALNGSSLVSKFPDGSPYKVGHSNLDAVPSSSQEVRFTGDGRSVTKWTPKKKVRSKDLKD